MTPRRVRIFLFLLAASSCGLVAAQTDPDPTADLKKQKEMLQLQLDVYTLQKSLAATQQAPSAASTLKDQLQAEKDLADLKSAMATSEVTRVKTEIGSVNTANLPKGDATLTGVDIQPTILGYGALKTAIGRIDTAKFCPGTVVLGSGPTEQIVALKAYTALVGVLTDRLDKYQAPLDGTTGNATFIAAILPAAVFAGIDAVVALGSLFKTDVTMNGVAMTADEKASRFLMEQHLQERCTVVDAQGFTGPVKDDSAFAKRVRQLDDELDTVVTIEGEIKARNIPEYTQKIAEAKQRLALHDALVTAIADARKKLDAPRASARDKSKLRELIRVDAAALKPLDPKADRAVKEENEGLLGEANDRVAAVDDLSGKVNKVLTALYKVDDAGTPFLTHMMEAEAIAEAMKDARFLTMSVAKLGGNNIVKKNAFHTSVRYAGGVVVAYQVKDKNSLTVVASGLETAYSTQDGTGCTQDGKDGPLQEPCPVAKQR